MSPLVRHPSVVVYPANGEVFPLFAKESGFRVHSTKKNKEATGILEPSWEVTSNDSLAQYRQLSTLASKFQNSSLKSCFFTESMPP